MKPSAGMFIIGLFLIIAAFLMRSDNAEPNEASYISKSLSEDEKEVLRMNGLSEEQIEKIDDRIMTNMIKENRAIR